MTGAIPSVTGAFQKLTCAEVIIIVLPPQRILLHVTASQNQFRLFALLLLLQCHQTAPWCVSCEWHRLFFVLGSHPVHHSLNLHRFLHSRICRLLDQE